MPNRVLIAALVIAIIIGLIVYVPEARKWLSPRTQPETAAQTLPIPSPTPTPSPAVTPSPPPYSVLQDERPLATITRLDWGQSPFEILVPGVELLIPTAAGVQEPTAATAPLVLQAIFSGTKGNIAKINGVLLREGEAVFDAIVLSISLAKRAVEVRRGDGTIEILRVFPSQ